MVSAEEIGAVAVFAALTIEERERLSRAAADISLGPVKRVAATVGEGSMAIAFVHQYLKELDVPS